ncbi:MAG: hypothetical protein JO258_00130 [Alphaproteobacteria bacterium]|nr:hypothetical protein [Alphaproteobacteria bacterium]
MGGFDGRHGNFQPWVDRPVTRREDRRLLTGQKSCDVHVFFANDAKVRAPFDAQARRSRMSGEMTAGVLPLDIGLIETWP